MLTEFALDTSFFESDALKTKTTNRDFLKLWKKYGVLILGENQEIDEILKQLKGKIPPEVYQDWKESFEDNICIKSKNSWKSFCDYNDYSEILNLNSFFKTGITEATTSEWVRGLPNYISFCNKSNFEVLDVDDQSISYNFLKSEKESVSDIMRGSNNQKIWENKFDTLAKYTKDIVLLDRYFFKNIRVDSKKGRKTSVEVFLTFLLQYRKKFNLTFISEGHEENSDEHIEICEFFNSIAKTELAKSFNKINLISKTEKYFQSLSHERFISFDKYVCSIGPGLSIFSTYTSNQTDFKMVLEEYSCVPMRVVKARKNPLWEKEYLPKK
ncbi:hypothetical protein [Acinetobacter sp.]|uniref:hypothetical protein n=1 Tax=Acinetobacter sp. TaxID=472 RepID=UPI002FC60895